MEITTVAAAIRHTGTFTALLCGDAQGLEEAGSKCRSAEQMPTDNKNVGGLCLLHADGASTTAACPDVHSGPEPKQIRVLGRATEKSVHAQTWPGPQELESPPSCCVLKGSFHCGASHHCAFLSEWPVRLWMKCVRMSAQESTSLSG